MEQPSHEPSPKRRSGAVALVGRANVGKSTLLNAILKQKVAAVSPRAQTTRTRILGVRTTDHSQIAFLDTPGIHDPQHHLGRAMQQATEGAMAEADVLVWVVDVSRPPAAKDEQLAASLAAQNKPIVIAMNKADQLGPDEVIPFTDAYRALAPSATWMLTIATKGHNLEALCALVEEALPVGEPSFPPDMLTDQSDVALAAEMIRESALYLLRQEVPHGVAVEPKEMVQRPGGTLYVAADLVLEREAHKPIVIGKDGHMLRRIGQAARRRLERRFAQPVYLDLYVVVRPSWRDNRAQLRRLGLSGG